MISGPILTNYQHINTTQINSISSFYFILPSQRKVMSKAERCWAIRGKSSDVFLYYYSVSLFWSVYFCFFCCCNPRPGFLATRPPWCLPRSCLKSQRRRDARQKSTADAMWCCSPTIDSEIANVLPHLGICRD